MKKPIPKKVKTLVCGAIKRHAWNIGVSQYIIDILWMEKDDDAHDDYSDVVARIIPNRRYLRADLKIYPNAIKTWKERGDNWMEEIIAHEIAHLATQHLYEVGIARYCDEGEMQDARESLTEMVGQLSYKLDCRNKSLKNY